MTKLWEWGRERARWEERRSESDRHECVMERVERTSEEVWAREQSESVWASSSLSRRGRKRSRRVYALLQLNEQLLSSVHSSLHPCWAVHRRIRLSGPALGLRFALEDCVCNPRGMTGNPPRLWGRKLIPEWILKPVSSPVRGLFLHVEEVKLHLPGRGVSKWDHFFLNGGAGECLGAPWDAPPAWFCWRGCAPSLRGTVAT